MSALAYERLHQNLRDLKLQGVEEILDSYLEIAAKREASVLEILDYLIDQEKKRRETHLFEARLKWSRLPVRKELGEFDFTFQPTIDPMVIQDLATLRFLHSAENVVFFGPPGVGKTHLAIGLGIAAMMAGFSTYFITASQLIERMMKAYRRETLDQFLKGLTRYRLLIIDEIGYRPFDSEAGYCFFQVISRRYERSSTMLTSNKSYGEWGDIFQDQEIATAVLDRLLHHCVTVNIRGESYRLKKGKRIGLTPPLQKG